MKITIECSIAEVIDKITILEIKLNKSLTEESFNNINKELNSSLRHIIVTMTSYKNGAHVNHEKSTLKLQ